MLLMPDLAIRAACTLTNRLHRDISVVDLILVRDHPDSVRKGHLIDWEVSSEVNDSGASQDAGWDGMLHNPVLLQCDSQVCHKGNLFMSRCVQVSVDGSTGKHILQDEMESPLCRSLLWLPLIATQSI